MPPIFRTDGLDNFVFFVRVCMNVPACKCVVRCPVRSVSEVLVFFLAQLFCCGAASRSVASEAHAQRAHYVGQYNCIIFAAHVSIWQTGKLVYRRDVRRIAHGPPIQLRRREYFKQTCVVEYALRVQYVSFSEVWTEHRAHKICKIPLFLCSVFEGG